MNFSQCTRCHKDHHGDCYVYKFREIWKTIMLCKDCYIEFEMDLEAINKKYNPGVE